MLRRDCEINLKDSENVFEEQEESHTFNGRSLPALLLADVPKYIYPPTAGKGLDQPQTFAVFFFSMKQEAVKKQSEQHALRL